MIRPNPSRKHISYFVPPHAKYELRLTPALEATWKTNVDLRPLSRTCETESSFGAMSVSFHNLV